VTSGACERRAGAPLIRLVTAAALVLVAFTACASRELAVAVEEAPPPASLADARRGLTTTVHLPTDPTPPPEPPAGVLELVRYAAPLGENVAYVTPASGDVRKPAIVWIAGGFDWGIDAGSWEEQPRDNDQSARAFREKGLVLMRPSLRGSNGNPGRNECMLGEVDDVVAAAEWLAQRPDVDPQRIYLGGHSTGATLALLVAESTDRFRAVFAFGPVADVRHYGADACFGEDAPTAEWQARAAWPYLGSVKTPTWIVEGEAGNVQSIAWLMQHAGSAPVRSITVPGRDHFSVLAPGTEAVADAILADTGAAPPITLTAADLAR
jgi:dipeptidyl aminopeptidase/acylaminoacyl peptidase